MASKKKIPAAAPQDGSVEPSIRVFTRWTPQLIQAAEISADGGDLTQAARVVSWLLTDDRIRGCLNARIQTLLGLVPGFEKSGDRRRSTRAVNALEAEEDYWASYPESELWLMIAWGLMLGVDVHRHDPQFTDGHGDRLLPCPKFWHPATGLRFDGAARQWKIRVANTGLAWGSEEVVTPGDGTWVMHAPFGLHRPWDLGLWKCLAWWKLLKEYGRSDWARNMEKGSLLVLTQSLVQQNAPGQLADTKATRNDSASAIYQRGKDAVAALPVGKDLKLIETSGKAHELYKSGIELANEAIAVAIRGNNLTTQVDGGSLAAAEVHERTGDFVNLRFDAESLTTTLHDQSLTWWAEWNFGDRNLAPWPDYPVAPQRNLSVFADTVSKFNLAVQQLEQNGFEVDREKAIEEFDLQDWVKAGKKPAVPPPNSGLSPQPGDNGSAPQPGEAPQPPAQQQ